MNDGRRAELEERVEQLETAVVALLGEYAAARTRLEDVETAAGEPGVETADGASDIEATANEPTPVSETTAPDADADTAPELVDDAPRRPTVSREDEATQEEVERAVRALEEDAETEREEAGLIES